MSSLRRCAAALAAAAIAATAAPSAWAAPSPSSSMAVDPALYGQGDPTYDGVWRQSFALLALDTAGVEPAEEAVDWLVSQQCADGGWAAFRADVKKACDPRAEDTNATAAAAQALAALGGHQGPIDRATVWLRKVQNADGGWSHNPGAASDANSTALVVSALTAAGRQPAPVVETGKSPYDALASFQLGCTAAAAHQGAFAYQPDRVGRLVANDSATVAAALAMLGKGLPVRAPAKEAAPPKSLDCTGAAGVPGVPGSVQQPENRAVYADAAAAFLSARLTEGGQHLKSPQQGAGPDHGTTAKAALALAAGGHLTPARKAVSWLEKHSARWSKGQPTALAELILAARATGGDPRDFGGADLVKQLVALGPPVSAGVAGAAENAAAENGGGLSPWYTVVLGLLVGIGGGFLISMRKNKD